MRACLMCWEDLVKIVKQKLRQYWLQKAVVAALVAAGVAHGADTQVRTTGYDYDPSSGLLLKEMQEPNDATLCVIRAFSNFDGFGRAKTVTVRNCNSAQVNATAAAPSEAAPLAADATQAFIDRVSTTAFATDPRFVGVTTNAGGHVDSYEYDTALGVPTKKTEKLDVTNSRVTLWKYDKLGRKTLEVRGDDNGTQWDYAYCSGVNGGTATCPTVGGAAGAYVITITPIHATGLGTPPARTLDAVAVTANGPYTRVYYDRLGREIRTATQGFDASGVTSRLVIQDTKRNTLGDVTDKSLPYYEGDTAKWVSYTYDELHRVKTITQAVGGNANVVKTIAYSGLQTSTTDPITPGSPEGSQTIEVKNLVGLQESVTDAKGGCITHKYDAFGNRVETIDPSKNVLSARYDRYGRKTQSNDPDLGAWSYTYDALGQLKTQTDAKAKVTYLSYDKLGRLTQRSEDDLVSKWGYDAYVDGGACAYGRGQLCESQVSGFIRKYTFDSFTRPSTNTVSVGAASPVTYVTKTEYDTNGRVSKITYPRPTGGIATKAQVVQYNYSTLGYLQSVQDMRGDVGTALWTAKAMDAAGRHTKFAYANDVVTNNEYFDDGRLNKRQAGLETSNVNDNSVLNLSHSYDQAGNLINRMDITIGGVNTDYTYDELYRLKAEKRTGGSLSVAQNSAWDYDALGNMITRSENGQVNTYNYPSSGSGSRLPHAVANVGGVVNNAILPTYAYDENGNLTSGGGRAVTWTTYNMVSSITKGSTQLSYTYDAEHARAQEVYKQNGTTQRTTTYVSSLYEEESGAAGLIKKFFVNAGGANIAVISNLNDSDAGWSIKYWHKDHLGSNMVVTAANHAVVERLAYEPFGKRRFVAGQTDANGTLVATSTDRGYTEHEHMDEVGLINMNGRVYDPALGRFMSADSIVPNPSFTQDYNRYAYVLNNPLTYIDPTGHSGELSQEQIDGFPGVIDLLFGTDFSSSPNNGISFNNDIKVIPAVGTDSLQLQLSIIPPYASGMVSASTIVGSGLNGLYQGTVGAAREIGLQYADAYRTLKYGAGNFVPSSALGSYISNGGAADEYYLGMVTSVVTEPFKFGYAVGSGDWNEAAYLAGGLAMAVVVPEAPKGVHKNSLSYVGETHVYRIKGPDDTTHKIGESARGLNAEGASIRAEQQARRLTRETGDVYNTEIRKTFPDKASAREYETRVIERFRSMYGEDKLPGNLTNR